MKRLLIIFLLFCSCLLKAQVTHTWQPLGKGLNWDGWELLTDTVRNVLYVTGGFDTAGTVPVKYLAQWDGSDWSSIGSGTGASYPISDMLIFNDSLYASGAGHINGVFMPSGMGIWDGISWTAMPPNNRWLPAERMCVYNNELYIASDEALNGKNIAKWDGANWIDLYPDTSRIFAIHVYKGELYVAGQFKKNNWWADKIVKYNGSVWSDVASLNGRIDGFVTYNNDLYAGGWLGGVDTVSVQYIARYDGSRWYDVGGGTNNYARPYVANNELYAAGFFSVAGNDTIIALAKWNGTKWVAVGGEIKGIVSHVAWFNNELYISGTFNEIGGRAIKNIARYCSVAVCDTNISVQEIRPEPPAVGVYPNPHVSSSTIEVKDHTVTGFTFTLHDALGREVRRTTIAGNQFTLYREALQSGIYFYTITAKDKLPARGKVIVE